MKDSIFKVLRWVWIGRMVVLWWIGIVVVTGVTLYLFLGWRAQMREASMVMAAMCVGAVVLVVLVGVHFVHCFTRDLPSPKETLSRELRSIFVYAYVFQVLAIGFSLAPFVVTTESLSSRNSWAGVEYGCSHAEEGYGSELTRCTNESGDGQWLVHVGGRLVSLEARTNGKDGARAEFGRGLVIPLYVVVLAIIGGAVGMTRRLPEIQRRAAYSVQRKGDDAISPIMAREMVVFQIMQILAAPLIAIVAFSVFEPDTVAAAVLVGFASGFASEAILMKLRQASEAIVGNVRGQ